MIDFESSLDKIAKMLSRRYGVNVVFEGTKAFTDGKTITLPYFETLTESFKNDLNGFLDHEIAHIKFTDFSIKSSLYCKTKFIFDIFNALEDIRIEKKIVELHPGMAYNIGPLREKYNEIHRSNIASFSLTEKIVFACQLYVQGIKFDAKNEEFNSIFETLIPVLNKFPKSLTSRNIYEMAKEIEEILKMDIPEEKEKSKSKEKSKEKSEKSESSEKSSGESSDADSDDESDSSTDSDEKEDDKSDDSKSEKDDEKEKSKTDIKKETKEKIKKELSAPAEKESKFDIEKAFGDIIKKEIESGDSKIREKLKEKDYGKIKYDPSKHSIPSTTRFDTVTDYSGKGNKEQYLKDKASVEKTILPIKQNLERLLKAKENAKWNMEKERGSLNPRSFAKMQTDKSYRTVFKDFTKTETTNVAVQILIDQSGSMSGSGKIKLAKLTAIALGEALKDLNITFEITGFNSVYSDKMSKVESSSRFNRTRESLELNIFKSFDSGSLDGITKLYSGANNTDGESLKWAALRLSERKEKRKIFLVLSDGQPADASDLRLLDNDLKLKVAQIAKSGIEIIGFGIMTDAVKQYYPDYVIVNDVSSLPKECMNKLAKIILKG